LERLPNYVSVGDWFIISPYLQYLDMPLFASRLQLLIETPADRSLCHIFVALSDQWISTPLSVEHAYYANDHSVPTCFEYLASCPPFGTPTDRSLCHLRCSVRSMVSIISLPFEHQHTFVALSDQWISTSFLPLVGLPPKTNDHNQLTSLSPDVKF
jgi:hypothetical protein